MLLEHCEYPEDFPCNFKVAYSAPSKELVFEFQLPSVEIIPKELEYRYVRARDSLESRSRKESDIRELYKDIVAALALRALHIIFKMNPSDQLLVVAFNGYVETIDRTVGRKVKPHLISVRVARDRFAEIDLRHVDKAACLRNLGARLSSRPNEHLPAKPIVEFDMVDKRFVDGTDMLAGLESRPNLMELTPFEFENLVGNLFSKMGLEAKQTRTSRNGGVDVVAFDVRPVLGGKVVIQAKRYRHTVGVAAVRDLFGTMMNEGANKGILVTTSGYGPDAFDFARDKPIELIDGGNLLYLLAEHSQVQARIIMPEDCA